MFLFDNPLVWLRRFRKRKGYGVHSPFAFSFITEVLTEHEGYRYYGYDELDRDLRWWQRFRYRKVLHLMFRLSNYASGMTMTLLGADPMMTHAADLASKDHSTTDGTNADEEMLVIIGINSGEMRSKWRSIVKNDGFTEKNNGYTVTFDLYDIGIAFRRRDLNRQHYIVNW